MNQNNKNKVKDFFRKEGFYFVLILCLCVVAIAANFALRGNNSETNKQEEPSNEFTLNVNDTNEENELSDASDQIMQNADRVEEESNTEVAEEESNTEVVEEESNTEVVEENQSIEEVADSSIEEAEEVSMEEEAAETSATVVEVVFQLPLQGEIARTYDESMVKVLDRENGARHESKGGVDISAAEGSVVKVAADGIVETVANTPKEGNYVVVAHANGMKTIYANLSENILVAEGESIVSGTELGMVGNSSEIFTEDIFGDVLNLQLLNSEDKQLNPSEYFNF